MSVSGHCDRSLLLFALGVTGTLSTVVESLEVLKKSVGVMLRDVVKWWAWQSGVKAWT